MADLLPDLPTLIPSDPDAQATVTDFLDYTEFFPSDLFRSLTLIGQLDEVYQRDASKVHSLTKTYGTLPRIPAAERPDPQNLRMDISLDLEHALRSRQAAFAEASRIRDVASNLSTRITHIRQKLQALPRPPSRDHTPVAPSSPNVNRNRSGKVENSENSGTTPKITLHLDGNNTQRSGRFPKQRGHCVHRRTIIPGDVLPALELLSSGGDVDSSVNSDSEGQRDASTPIRLSQPRQLSEKVREKVVKAPKIPKDSRDIRIRPPGVMGTNVHSSVAGISVSNAMACLAPPPENPKPGSTHAPWLKLTEWELNALRKKMKKNADWQPSNMMIARCLKETGRGIENMNIAMALAAETGEEFLDEEPPDFIRPPARPVVHNPSSLLGSNSDVLENRGMKLNQAKKIKRENMLKAKEAQEASELDDANKRISEAALAVQTLFSKPNLANSSGADSSNISGSKTIHSMKSLDNPKKRKIDDRRDEDSASSVDSSAEQGAGSQEGTGTVKKLKLTSSSTNVSTPLQEPSTNIKTAQMLPSTTTLLLAEAQNRGISTSAPTTSHRSRRASTTNATIEAYSSSLTNLNSKRPLSSRSNKTNTISLTLLPSKKAASAEPSQPNGQRRISLRRVSDGSIPPGEQQAKGSSSSRIGPVTNPTNASKRNKRPAPGVLTSYGEDGGAKVSLGKRKAAPARKISLSGASSSKKPGTSNATGSEEDIDPDEPLYCICGDVSFGTMIACENEKCEREWFHLGCVGLEEIPGRRAKWYCPECRKKFKIGGDGTVDVSRRVK